MNTTSRGFVAVIFLALIALFIGAGIYYYNQKAAVSTEQDTSTDLTNPAPGTPFETPSLVYLTHETSGIKNPKAAIVYQPETGTTYATSSVSNLSILYPTASYVYFKSHTPALKLALVDANAKQTGSTVDSSTLPGEPLAVSDDGTRAMWCENGPETRGGLLIANFAVNQITSLNISACGLGEGGYIFSEDNTKLYYLEGPYESDGEDPTATLDLHAINLQSGTDSLVATTTSGYYVFPNGVASWTNEAYDNKNKMFLETTDRGGSSTGTLLIKTLPPYTSEFLKSTDASIQIVDKLALPQGYLFLQAMFSADGQGVFYQADHSNFISDLGYYDIAAHKNYFPLIRGDFEVANIFAASDKEHLYYLTGSHYAESGTQPSSLVMTSISQNNSTVVDDSNNVGPLDFMGFTTTK